MEAILEHFFDELHATYELALRETLDERVLKRSFLAWKAMATRRRKKDNAYKQRRKLIKNDEDADKPLPRRDSLLRKSLSKLFSKVEISAPDVSSEKEMDEQQRRSGSSAGAATRRPRSSILHRISFSSKPPKKESLPPPLPEPMHPAEAKLLQVGKGAGMREPQSVFQIEQQSAPLFHFRASKSSQDVLQVARSSSSAAGHNARYSDYYKQHRDQVELLQNLNAKREARKQRKKSKKQSNLVDV